MSVYKEINNLIHTINQACLSTRIYNDAADSGLPLLKDGPGWANIKHHLSNHTIPGSKKKIYKGAHQITISTRHNEHTTPLKQHYYEITYHTVWNHLTLITPCTGFLTIRKVMPSELDTLNNLRRLQYDAKFPNGEPDIHTNIDPAGRYSLHSHE